MAFLLRTILSRNCFRSNSSSYLVTAPSKHRITQQDLKLPLRTLATSGAFYYRTKGAKNRAKVEDHSEKPASASRDSETSTKETTSMPKRSAPEDATNGEPTAKAQKLSVIPKDHPELKHPKLDRAKEIDAHPPYLDLYELIDNQPDATDKPRAVLHWFRSKDLRIQDNKALHAASELAQEHKVPLVTCYLNCEPEFQWHGTSPARLDFIFENLRIMQKELAKLNIPLVFLDAKERKEKVNTVVKFIRDNEIDAVFANYEYEVDELRRDIKLLKLASEDKGFQVNLFHDQTVMEPATMTTGAGTPMKVFTPYHGAWLAEVKSDPSLIDTVPDPAKNSDAAAKKVSKLMKSEVPKPPKVYEFDSEEDRKRLRKLWPAGHQAGMDRMQDFLERIDHYGATRSDPGADSTSRMSPYLAAGVVSVRECLQLVKKFLGNNKTDFSQGCKNAGVASWVREICFRELYRQTTITTPHTSMNLPQNMKFDLVEWEDDEENYKKWEEGTTGYPLVDAGMRQLKHEAWMHNRARMNVSSFLYNNLLIDYRRGERYFVNTLIDWDLNNNTQGWEPSYTVFNPISQAEKNDPSGDYIRKWVPELKELSGKAVYMPYERLSEKEFKKLGYPAPCVDWKKTKARCLERFKRDMQGKTI